MRGSSQTYIDFSGGVDLESGPYELDANQAREVLNVHTSATGQLRKREGFTTFAELTLFPHTLFAADVSDPSLIAVGPVRAAEPGISVSPAGTGISLEYVYAAAGEITSGQDRVVSVDTAGTVTDVTPTSAPTVNTRWYITQAPASGGQGPVFAMNGVDTPKQWTGSGAFANWTAATGTVPVGKYLTYHGSRLWCAGVAAQPSRLYFSGITGTAPDTRNWDSTNYVDLEPSDGDAITAIATLGSYLIVFKSRKVFVVYDLITGANRQLADTVGCVAHRSCVETRNGLFFWDESQGLMVTDGNSVDHVSTPVDPLLREAAAFDPEHSYAAGVYWDDRMLLSLCTEGTRNDRTLELDLRSNAWWIHDCAANDWAYLDPLGTPGLYSADPSDARIQEAFTRGVYEDSDGPYSAFWSSANFVWGDPHLQKRVHEVRVDGAGNWNLAYATDFSESFTDDEGTIWYTNETERLFAPSTDDGTLFAPSTDDGSIFAPVSTQVTSRRYYTLGLANAWAFRLQNSDSGDFQSYAMSVATQTRRD